MMDNRRGSLIVALLAAATFVYGCPDIPEDPAPEERVSAVFDSETATIPLPNSAALEADGTLPTLPGAEGDDANAAFLSWLDGLHGWLPQTPIEVPFDGALDPDTVTAEESTHLFRVAEDGSLERLDAEATYVENEEGAPEPVCNPAVCTSIVRITPDAELERGTRYVAVVTKDVQGVEGLAVVESPGVFFALSPSPLVDEDGEVLVGALEDDPRTASALEELRSALAPLVDGLQAEGIGRDDIASIQSWQTARDSFTVLDPATATLPIPNTLALDDDGTFPEAALGFCEDEGTCGGCEDGRRCIDGTCRLKTDCAQGGFDAYLDGLHGWPTTTPITLPVDGSVDPASLSPETVQLWSLDEEGAASKVEETTIEWIEEESVIHITPPEEMSLNARFFAFATDGVTSTEEGPSGRKLPLKPPAAIRMAVQPGDVVELGDACEEPDGSDAEWRSSVCGADAYCAPAGPGIPEQSCVTSTVPRIPAEDAASIQNIRPLLRPIAQQIEAGAGVPWDELVSVWTWFTWTDTFIVFDPNTGEIPFPHALLELGCPPDRPICNILDPNAPTALQPILETVSKRSGFSTTGTNWLPTAGPPIDETSLTEQPVLLAEREGDGIPEQLAAEEYTLDYEFGHVLVDFNRPLKPEVFAAGVVSDELMGANGHPVQPSPAFVFLRSTHPLVDDEGNKTVAEIPDDDSAELLEAARQQFEPLFQGAALFGLGRTQVAGAWAYATGETTGPLQRFRAMAQARLDEDGDPVATAPTPNVVDDPGSIEHPDVPGLTVDLSAVQTIHWDVQFDTVEFLTQQGRLSAYPNAPRIPVGVTLFLPKDEDPVDGQGCEPPYDVAIAQHGLSGYRKSTGLVFAQQLAERCVATVSMDFPLHGGRTVGPTPLHPTSRPESSGQGYISGDFSRVRSNMIQSVVDQSVLTRVLRSGGFDDVTGVTFTDDNSRIGYIGVSLGGFVGALLTTVEPDVGPAVLNVAGGDFEIMIEQSEEFLPLLEDAGLMPGTFDFIRAAHMVQWVGEHVDPFVFAPHTIADPLVELEYDPAGDSFSEGETLEPKDVLIQMVRDDPITPNASTRALAETMGVSLDQTTFNGVEHGFIGELDPNEPGFAAAVCGRQQAAQWLESGFAGTAELTSADHAVTCVANQ